MQKILKLFSNLKQLKDELDHAIVEFSNLIKHVYQCSKWKQWQTVQLSFGITKAWTIQMQWSLMKLRAQGKGYDEERNESRNGQGLVRCRTATCTTHTTQPVSLLLFKHWCVSALALQRGNKSSARLGVLIANVCNAMKGLRFADSLALILLVLVLLMLDMHFSLKQLVEVDL